MLIVTPTLTIPVEDLRFSFSRSSGPGGQNVNKVNSKATLHWPAVASTALPPDVRERLMSGGLDPIGGAPEEFARFIRSEIVKWSKIAKDVGAKAE